MRRAINSYEKEVVKVDSLEMLEAMNAVNGIDFPNLKNKYEKASAKRIKMNKKKINKFEQIFIP